MSNECSDAITQDRKRSANWTEDDTEVLVQILLKHKDSGRSQDNGFKPEVWKEAAAVLQPRTILGGVKTAEACKSRWQRLQRDFKAAKDVQNLPGITWSDTAHKLVGSVDAWAGAGKRLEPYKWKKIYLPWYRSFELLCPTTGQQPLLMRRRRGSVGSISTMDTSGLSLSGSSTRDVQLRTPSQSSSTNTGMFSVSSAISTPADELGPNLQKAVWEMAQANGVGFDPMMYRNSSMLSHVMPFDQGHRTGAPSVSLPPTFAQQPPNSASPVKRQKTWHEIPRADQRQTRSKQAVHRFQPTFDSGESHPMPPQFSFSPDSSYPGHALAVQTPHLLGLRTIQSPSGSGLPSQAPSTGLQFSPGVEMKASGPTLDAFSAMSRAPSIASEPETPFQVLRAGFTDAQRRTEALLMLQNKEAYLGEAGMLEVVAEFEINIAACDTYLAMKGDELRRQWIQRLLARRKRAGRS